MVAVSLVKYPGCRSFLCGGLVLIRGLNFLYSALKKIPPGKTVSYKELAQLIGAENAHRAVAGACASNKLAVAIPCHRVVRSDGKLSGYRWGIERKRTLLTVEKRTTGET